MVCIKVVVFYKALYTLECLIALLLKALHVKIFNFETISVY